jgi:hypothetical protein
MHIEPIPHDQLIADPLQSYKAMRDRLRSYGPNAPFPEFKPAVDFLVAELTSADFQQVREDHPDLEFELKEVQTLLAHVNVQAVFVKWGCL